ncbi:MAG TPA: alpha-galactosidase, partial [Bacteroidales bacterium]|nr:alpha-galactosidase [Bacteroidales bacterium]
MISKLPKHQTVLLFVAIALMHCSIKAQSQPLALTPPMGWNSWNLVESEVSDPLIREIADAIFSTGMRDAGYQYIIIDDFWVGGRDATNHLFPDRQRFPHGMKALADYVHSKGLKLGIYSDAAEYTCGGVTASYNFEELDAQTFADWGIDYLKYDYCNAPEDVTTAFTRYKKMGDALKKTGRPMVYAICEWGQRKPWLWARAAGGHLWRTTWDSRDVWQSNNKDLTGIMEIFDQQKDLAQYAGPGGWNDPDLLMVGLYGKGKSSSVGGRFKGCNTIEYRSHFILWAMLSAPLIVNLDVRSMDKETADILLNKEIIAINQDSLGKQAVTLFIRDNIQVLKKELRNGDLAICVFNRGDQPASFSLDLKKDLNIWFPA